MPVTKTAKRALRVSLKKNSDNKSIVSGLDAAIRLAKKTKTAKSLAKVFSLADRAAKSNVIHTKKADRIKARLTKRVSPSK
jgi:ribosomal protein S20